MKKGKSYTVQEIKEKMAHYCAYQDRCHFEVEQKLNDFKLIPEARDLILLDLLQHDFLNEERFAKSFARGKFNQKKWGKIKITNELKQRKLNQKLIEIGLKEIDETNYQSTLKDLFLKKWQTLKGEKTFIRKQKTIRYLMQKGYEYELINEAVKNLELDS